MAGTATTVEPRKAAGGFRVGGGLRAQRGIEPIGSAMVKMLP